MSAVPKKKRRGRPRGSKNKPKVVVPPEIKETSRPYQQDIVAGLEHDNPVRVTTPESSFVAGYFGLDKIEQPEQAQQTDSDSEHRKLFRETVTPIVERMMEEELSNHSVDSCRAKFQELAAAAKEGEASPSLINTRIADLEIPSIPTVWVETESFASEELKSILRQIDAKVKDLASYPMDHGLRCGMNEVEILLANNREKFKS